jgi:hypothetical protein
LNRDLHVVVFETYSDSKTLSASSVEKYFKAVLANDVLTSLFGRVEVDVIKSIGEVDRILALPDLRELKIIIRRPNPDGMPPDLADEIEERLREQNAEEYEEKLKSKDGDGLKPNERTRKLAYVAIDNGEVEAKSIVGGVNTPHGTSEKPLKESETYSKDDQSTQVMFRKMTEQILRKISDLRRAVGGGA